MEIGEYDIYFKPNLVTIPADMPVRVVLVNHGAAIHNFSITDHKNPGKNLNIAVDTEPGKTSETTITPRRAPTTSSATSQDMSRPACTAISPSPKTPRS